MKRIISAALGAVLAVLCLLAVPSIASAAGGTAAGINAKSPLRYIRQTYTFSTTSSITAAVVGVVPPGGAKLKDVVLLQVAAGTGGTSWAVAPKINGTTLCSTAGAIALSDGANKSVNTGVGGPIALAKPTGATKPVIKVDGTASATGGGAVTIDITLTGTYTVAVTGVVELYWEAAY